MEEKTQRLVEIARAYYLENRNQTEIAQEMGVTRSQVSRYLKEARELGIVQVRITVPGEQPRKQVAELQSLFPNLVTVVVAPIFSQDNESTQAIVGRYAANYLREVIRPGNRLVLGCGRTLRAMVDALQFKEVSNITVIQAMGNFGHEAHGIDYMEIAQAATKAFGAKLYYLSAPAILGKNGGTAKVMIDSNPTIREALDIARQGDICVVGLGSMESDQIYTRQGLVSEEELDELRGCAVGDICGRFYDRNGVEQIGSFSERTIGVNLNDIHNMKLRIGVACGPDKVMPIFGALKGDLINVLVTDEGTLRSILEIASRDQSDS